MIGMEPTWDDHVQNLLAVFRECRRVLRDDGTFWLNYGDAYSGGGRGAGGLDPDSKQSTNKGSKIGNIGGWKEGGWKQKNLMLMPARLAIALQDDGWILRSEVIWYKSNPMPESVTDRPACSHEKIFLFSKRPRYFYDHVAVRTPVVRTSPPDKGIIEGTAKYIKIGKFNSKTSMRKSSEALGGTANLRNVWSVATHAYRGAHFATYPPKLIIPCIKAGTSEKGCCSECGSPHERVAKKGKLIGERINQPGGIGLHHDRNDIGRLMQVHEIETVGWQPDCECDADTVPCRVLDPFGGSGTTAMVSNKLQRDATIIEISPEYAGMAAKRISDDGGFLVDVVVE